ncbi:hypothetical protein FRC12_022753 [Ceratobasidium sp. 428]|nr:hypothetical protein FRC12_022753 [Ceratobasidium sp. 428]
MVKLGAPVDPLTVEALQEKSLAPSSTRVVDSLTRTAVSSLDVHDFPHLNQIILTVYDNPNYIKLQEIGLEQIATAVPFHLHVSICWLQDPSDGVQVRAMVDTGAMLCVLDQTIWGSIEHAMKPLAESKVICQMANSLCECSAGKYWPRFVLPAGRWFTVQFKVFDSCGAFQLLLGKPWLQASGAMQVFDSNTLVVAGPGNQSIWLANHKTETKPEKKAKPKTETTPEIEAEQEGELDKPVDELDWNPFWINEALSEQLEAVIGMLTNPLDELLDSLEGIVKTPRTPQSPELLVELTDNELSDKLWHKAWQAQEEAVHCEILLIEDSPQDKIVNHLWETLKRARRNMEQSRGPADLFKLNDNTGRQEGLPQVKTPPTAGSACKSDPFAPA